MSKSSLLLATLASVFLLNACEEKPIVIPQLEVGERKILVEELTGVRCQNCPQGAAELQELSGTLGENLIVVSLHSAAGYDEPFGNSKYDFRSASCRAVTDYIYVNGDPGAPAASIDRQLLQDQTEIFINRPWKGSVNARAAVAPDLGLFINNSYDQATRELDLQINISPDELLQGEIRLSVYITEDSIVDVQQKGTERILDYVHRHVFRTAVSAPTGDNISGSILTGQPFSKSYTVTLPAEWKAEHCAIVAFIHRHGDVNNRQVLQADEKHIY